MGQEEAFVDTARKEEVLKDGIGGFTNVKTLSTASLRWGVKKEFLQLERRMARGRVMG